MDKPFRPPTHEEIQHGLSTLPNRIYNQGIVCAGLKETWMVAEEEYDLEQAKSLITNKTKNEELTAPMLKAMATVDTHETRLKCIHAEADYGRAECMHKQLDDKFTAVKKEVEFLKVSGQV